MEREKEEEVYFFVSFILSFILPFFSWIIPFLLQ